MGELLGVGDVTPTTYEGFANKILDVELQGYKFVDNNNLVISHFTLLYIL